MSIGEPREPQLNTEFDPERHVKIPDKELPEEEKGRGSFVTKEAYETQRLAEVVAIYKKTLSTTGWRKGETNPQDILRAEAIKEDIERSVLSEEDKNIERIRHDVIFFDDLPEDQKRNLRIIKAAIEKDPVNISFVPDGLRETIQRLAGKQLLRHVKGKL